MAESIRDVRLPRYEEIPNVGLYLEQVTKYIEEYLAPIENLTITASMISNYVKQKIMPDAVMIKHRYLYPLSPKGYAHSSVR